MLNKNSEDNDLVTVESGEGNHVGEPTKQEVIAIIKNSEK